MTTLFEQLGPKTRKLLIATQVIMLLLAGHMFLIAPSFEAQAPWILVFIYALSIITYTIDN